MKLEKVVSRPKVGLWVILFILGLAFAGALGTFYNFEVVKHVNLRFEGIPWTKVVLGSLGFFGIIGFLILFFARLLREMKISQIQADFLDRISHELRTPLSTLTLISDLLKREPKSGGFSDSEKKLWNSHDLELERLKNEVELLLQAARLRETRLAVDFEEIDLVLWLENKRASFEQLLGEKSVLKILMNSSSCPVRVDPRLLELILRNLFDNARKFALQAPVVEVNLQERKTRFPFQKTTWRLLVTDQGLGFSEENQAKLFKRFSRLTNQNQNLKSTAIPGTGLGLYLSASASKAMGLTLTGKSLGEGKGARFILEGKLS